MGQGNRQHSKRDDIDVANDVASLWKTTFNLWTYRNRATTRVISDHFDIRLVSFRSPGLLPFESPRWTCYQNSCGHGKFRGPPFFFPIPIRMFRELLDLTDFKLEFAGMVFLEVSCNSNISSGFLCLSFTLSLSWISAHQDNHINNSMWNHMGDLKKSIAFLFYIFFSSLTKIESIVVLPLGKSDVSWFFQLWNEHRKKIQALEALVSLGGWRGSVWRKKSFSES